MLVSPEKLDLKLSAQDLKAGYLVFGDEPLQLMESVDKIRAHIKANGANERIVLEVERNFDWDTLTASMSGMSLFAEQRIVEIRLGERRPDKKGSQLIQDFLAAPVGDDVLLISAGKLDRNQQKAKWFKALESQGLVIQARQLAAQAFERWIVTRAASSGLTIDREVADLIATRAEGNMLAAAQELEKLSLISGKSQVDSSTALKAIADSARYDVFKFIDTVLGGRAAHAIRMLRGLREEGIEPVIINWAITRELRSLAAMSADVSGGKPLGRVVADAGVWQSRLPVIENNLRRNSAAQFAALFMQSTRIDRMIKGSLTGSPWDEMELLCLDWAGAR